jgi:hypothetical protein
MEMKTTLKFPIFFQARPPRARGLRDIVLSYAFEADIPEISTREADVVFEASTCHDPDRDMLEVARKFRLLEYDSRLYRRLATASRVEDAMRYAFAADWRSANFSWAEGISLKDSILNQNPVGSLLQRQIAWKLQGDSYKRDRKENTWPQAYQRSSKQWGVTMPLNRYSFADIVATLENIDAVAVDRSLADFQHRTSQLLIVNGELWIESQPPVIQVEIGSGDSGIVALVYIATMPEGLTPWPNSVSFPLDRANEARDYARRLAETFGNADDVFDATVQYKADGGSLFDFDHEVIEMRDICHHIVVSNERYLRATDPAFTSGFLDDGMRASQEEAFHLAINADFVRGRYADLSSYFDAASTLWRKCRRPAYQFELPGNRKRAGDLMLARGYELLENAPIMLLPTSASPKP